MQNPKDVSISHEVKPLILNQLEVKKLLTKLDVKHLMRSLFLALDTNNAVQTPQTITPFPDDKGDYITYLGAMALEGVFGAKLSPYLVTEKAPIITAWTNLMSMRSGQPLLWCDSGELTVERTAGYNRISYRLFST